ncbi:MAG: LodA/GoxA family CTQ-dependent oxidase, partial [Dehalococcoidia bacterium]
GRRPPRPSFTRQIFPLLERHVQHQWVNAGFARDFGWGAAGNFLGPQVLSSLSDPSHESFAARQELFGRFRNPDYARMDPNALPPYYGDFFDLPPSSPRQWMAVLPIQYDWLRQWAAGDFEADWPGADLSVAQRLEDLPLEEQPGALDRAALDECLGGPFHPGCELTWPMRQPSLYQAPFRLRRRQGSEADWGEMMTSAIALATGGPLSASGPGDLTRWLAVPWQTDSAMCLSAYDKTDDVYLPAFWPARVPNDVLTLSSYRRILDPNAGAAGRQAAFAARGKWQHDEPQGDESFVPHINAFVHEWSQYGVVTPQPGPTGDPTLPETLWIELGRDLPGNRG